MIIFYAGNLMAYNVLRIYVIAVRFEFTLNLETIS
jgi:hypothetical protein